MPTMPTGDENPTLLDALITAMEQPGRTPREPAAVLPTEQYDG